MRRAEVSSPRRYEAVEAGQVLVAAPGLELGRGASGLREVLER
ncbi:hypothetical protein [Thermocatellispora tengchongensis]